MPTREVRCSIPRRRSDNAATAGQFDATVDRGDEPVLSTHAEGFGFAEPRSRPIGTLCLGSSALQVCDRAGLTETVILREELTIDAPALVVRQRLVQRLQVDGLRAESSAAFEQEHTLLVRAGVAGVTKTVAMATFPPYLRGETTVFPIRWVATGPLGELFPTLEANLEVGPTDDGRTLFVLIGAYRPPLHRIGQRIDRLVLHNVGTATARGFLAGLTAEVMTCPETGVAAQPQPGIANPAPA